MSELNCAPATGDDSAGAQPAAGPALNAGSPANGRAPGGRHLRQQRRRLNRTRRQFGDLGFRLFKTF